MAGIRKLKFALSLILIIVHMTMFV